MRVSKHDTCQCQLLNLVADATESLSAVLANRAVLIISHDARIASLADRAVLLHEGRIIAEGSPAEIFALT